MYSAVIYKRKSGKQVKFQTCDPRFSKPISVYVPSAFRSVIETNKIYQCDCEMTSRGYLKPTKDFRPTLWSEIQESQDITPVYTPPTIPSELKVSADVWKFTNISLHLNKYPFILGPKGCGKSELARQVAKANNMEFFEFDLGQAFKPKKFFIGGMVINDKGSTECVKSLFLKAFTSNRPTLIFLDELTRVPMQSANFLMTILSRNQSFIYDDDSAVYHYKGKDVHFIAAGNVGMSYVSTNKLDSAFEDRFIKIQMDYLSPREEAMLIQERCPQISSDDAQALAKVSYSLRECERKGSLSVSLSTRQILDAAAFVEAGIPLVDVVKTVILNNYVIADEYDSASFVLNGL